MPENVPIGVKRPSEKPQLTNEIIYQKIQSKRWSHELKSMSYGGAQT